MLVSDLFDACYAEWLYPAGVNRPAFDTLASSIGTGDTSLTLTGRVANVPNDTVLQLGTELVLVSASDPDTFVVTVQERGWLNTDAATHSAGALVEIDPKYPRKALLTALNALLGDLYGQGVYQIMTDSTQTYTRLGLTTLPAGGLRLLTARVNVGSIYADWRRLVPGKDYWVFPEDEPLTIQFRGGHEDRALKLTYVAAVASATDETDDLDDLGVPATLQPHLALGIAGYLLQSRELPRVQIEEIKRTLASQGIQVGAIMNVGQALLMQYRSFVQAERIRLDERRAHDMTFVPK